MPRVTFTRTLARHVDCPPQTVAGGTLRDSLEAVFANLPQLRGYILDDRGHCRQHVAIFVDGQQIIDRASLDQSVRDDGEIFIMQALSGG